MRSAVINLQLMWSVTDSRVISSQRKRRAVECSTVAAYQGPAEIVDPTGDDGRVGPVVGCAILHSMAQRTDRQLCLIDGESRHGTCPPHGSSALSVAVGGADAVRNNAGLVEYVTTAARALKHALGQ